MMQLSSSESFRIMQQHLSTSRAIKTLSTTTRLWFIVTYAGQLIFAFYILMFYWLSTANGQFEKWNAVNPHFYIKKDLTGNIVFAVHVALAAIITILGPLQLVPRIRKQLPRFHRISGRIYIYSAFLISSAGLYLTWVRGAVGGPFSQVTVSVNGLIIMVTAFYSIRYAVQRKIKEHNQWAVHLVLAMSGVWLFRVFLMLWLVIFQRPVGFDPETFTGPFLYTLAVCVYILPQAIVAVYFRAKYSGPPAAKYLFSTLLLLITLASAVGIFGAAAGMWLPRIRG